MIKIIYSHWLRTKRLPVRLVCILCPLLYASLFSLFLLLSNALRGIELFSFFSLFTMLTSFSMSFFVPMIYEADKEACLYANDLRSGVSRRKNFLGKFLLIALLVAAIEIIATLICILFLVTSMRVKIDLLQVLIFLAIQYLALMPMIVIYQFLTLKYSYTGSNLTGCFLTLSSILLGTIDLGGPLWRYLPFTWSIKLSTLYGNELISIGDIFTRLGVSCILTLILLWTFSIWYTKWDGLTQLEE
ncbi:ABC-2 family transporter permease [Granulicatella seriolae]|uniref:Lantibiotic immunity ABC transporter MutG family permease subunit n=1 Tax=Granulicatella seriolae TaxID=2967226 RepID=A0ABT1WNT8_9LACT|nr:hypothetical protein [Granulicatella seriolae]